MEEKNTISFETESEIEIDSTVYVVAAHYESEGENVKDKILSVLKERINQEFFKK